MTMGNQSNTVMPDEADQRNGDSEASSFPSGKFLMFFRKQRLEKSYRQPDLEEGQPESKTGSPQGMNGITNEKPFSGFKCKETKTVTSSLDDPRQSSYSTCHSTSKSNNMRIERSVGTSVIEDKKEDEEAVSSLSPHEPSRRALLKHEASPSSLFVSSNNNAGQSRNNRWMIPLLIVLIGTAASAAFIALGVISEHDDAQAEFEKRAAVFPSYFRDLLSSYQVAGLWAHQGVMHGDLSRARFAEIYQHIASTGLQFQSIEYIPRVPHSQRTKYEEETRAYLQQYFPNYNYSGFTSLQDTPNGPGRHAILPSPESDYYYVQHYVEPLENEANLRAVDFDAYSSSARRFAIDKALERQKVSLSHRFGHSPKDYQIIMIQPGHFDRAISSTSRTFHEEVEGEPEVVLAKIYFTLYDIMRRAALTQQSLSEKDVDVYLFDTSDDVQEERAYLGGVSVQLCCDRRQTMNDEPCFLPEVSLSQAFDKHDGSRKNDRFIYHETISVMSRDWTIVVIRNDTGLGEAHLYIIFGGIIIFVACACLALWYV